LDLGSTDLSGTTCVQMSTYESSNDRDRKRNEKKTSKRVTHAFARHGDPVLVKTCRGVCCLVIRLRLHSSHHSLPVAHAFVIRCRITQRDCGLSVRVTSDLMKPAIAVLPGIPSRRSDAIVAVARASKRNGQTAKRRLQRPSSWISRQSS
jgi:hypothetical protein